jgi:hypothetical protein
VNQNVMVQSAPHPQLSATPIPCSCVRSASFLLTHSRSVFGVSPLLVDFARLLVAQAAGLSQFLSVYWYSAVFLSYLQSHRTFVRYPIVFFW